MHTELTLQHPILPSWQDFSCQYPHLVSSVKEVFSACFEGHPLLAKPAVIYVGLSGGVDSVVLLALVKRYCDLYRLECCAIHVHHSLQASADDWEQFCRQLCLAWGVSFIVQHACIDLKQKRQRGLEAAAREARFQLFWRIVSEGSILCLAHHANDQAETVLLNLMRGSGVLGLAAMSECSIRQGRCILRPLFKQKRSEIEAFAGHYQLHWVCDPSNHQETIRRNYLRHQIVPRFEQIWPSMVNSITRASLHCQEATHLLDDLAKVDLVNLLDTAQPMRLNRAGLMALSLSRRKNALRFWFQQQKVGLPSERVMAEIEKMCQCDSLDYHACVRWGQVALRCYQEELRLDLNIVSTKEHLLAPISTEWVIDWMALEPIDGIEKQLEQTVSWLGGECRVRKVKGRGLSIHRWLQDGITYLSCILHTRPEGVAFQPSFSKHHTTLKKLFQQQKVPHWLREQIPYLSIAGVLVVIPKVSTEPGSRCCIAKGYEVLSADDVGLEFDFLPLK